jgi:hypothetical protein
MRGDRAEQLDVETGRTSALVDEIERRVARVARVHHAQRRGGRRGLGEREHQQHHGEQRRSEAERRDGRPVCGASVRQDAVPNSHRPDCLAGRGRGDVNSGRPDARVGVFPDIAVLPFPDVQRATDEPQ